MARINCSITVFTLLLSAWLIGEILTCNTSRKFNKQDRYYRNHNYQHYHNYHHYNNYRKRSVDENDEAANNGYRESYYIYLNTNCGEALCNIAADYPEEAIRNTVKQLKQIYESNKTTFNKEIDLRVTNFLSEHLNSDENPGDSADIVYEKSKGCQALGNVSFPQEGYTIEDEQTYYIVNVPNFPQKVNSFTCVQSKTACGDDIELPSTYSRTCKQVYRDEEFLVLPGNRSQYNVDDFQVRAFLVPDGCKCILLHDGY